MSRIELTITLPGNVISKKNSKRAFGNRIISSKAFLAYEKEMLQEIMFKRHRWPGGYPVEMKCVFFRKTKAKFDFSNMIESVQDILVKGGVIADDDYQHVYPVKPEVYFDKEHPRVTVVLTGPFDDSPF